MWRKFRRKGVNRVRRVGSPFNEAETRRGYKRWLQEETEPMLEDLARIKQQIPLRAYLQRRNWAGCRIGSRDEFVGLCPLHHDSRPSFYVNDRKNLFYLIRAVGRAVNKKALRRRRRERAVPSPPWMLVGSRNSVF